jgi:hypothetical protein
MPGVIQETSCCFLKRLAWLQDRQNNFCALVIILFADNYIYDMEEGAT